ncbi:MAG TPA: GNAT family N-acetyltransferase [Rhizomicrobium sp.]|nr:GNAT family N-acetyltransferase [Rhizomicrobium sp.]
MPLTIRPATTDDIPALRGVMNLAIEELLKPFLSPEQIAASHAVMGLDTQLIADGTYFVVEDDGAIAGCGGWSRRATLFGGDHSAGRDAALLDPAKDAAKVRAMYTHPAFARRGVGRMILQASERAAAAEGFAKVELAATAGGEPLYRACGYTPVSRFQSGPGDVVPMCLMSKNL